MRRIFLVLGGVLLMTGLCWGKDARLVKGDYEAAVGENGLEVKYKGVLLVCGSHFGISKPEWKGAWYSGRNLPASTTAKLDVSADRIVISDAAPEIGARITHEIRLDDSGVLVSFRVQVDKDIPPSPCEYVPIVFAADVIAGGQFRAMGLLGAQDWQPLPAEKPQATGPGTQMILGNVLGLEIAGKGVSLSVESLEGPSPSFYDMRSREYPPPDKNYWLLYSWPVSKGEMAARTRLSVRPAAPQAEGAVKGKAVVVDGKRRDEVRAIVIDRKAAELEKAAAKELQQYLLKIIGCEIPIVESGGRRPYRRGVIYVGRGGAAKGGFLFFGGAYDDGEIKALGSDGFLLRCRDGNVLVIGRNDRGTVYGVYRLLEKLGCRFYARELEAVPHGPSVEIAGPFTDTDGPVFEWRAMLGTIAPMKCNLSPGEWEASVAGVNVPKMMAFPKGGFWHHTMGFLLPAKDLAETHPEYLALLGGERRVDKPAVQQYCLSNPDLLKRMTDAVLAWVAADPDRLYYPVHYGDVVKFCECEKCKALIEEKGSLTDAVIWFDNQIAKAVARKFPGKFVTILAYHSTRRPPVKVKPERNLIIIFCAIVECQGRPWSHPINVERNVCKDLEGWIAVHPLGPKGIITFDYPTTYHFAGFPYPALYAYVENIRYYHQLGLRGVYVCGLGGWKHLEHAYSYVMPRIMWKPEQDMGALLDDFTKAWYGAAWKPMREYIEMLHQGAMNSRSDGVMDCHAGPGQKFFRDLYTPEFLARAEALFAKAEGLAENETVKRRIWKEKWGLLFVDLFLYAQKGADITPVATDSGVETRTLTPEQYRKMAEFLRINRLFNRPWDMEPRRRFTLSSLVGIEPESQLWWTCPAIREIMENPDGACEKQSQAARDLSGKLITLENQSLKAVLVPKLGGRVWRLYHKGAQQDLLWRGRIPISAIERGLAPDPYVNLGGYEEYMGEKFGSPGWAESYECKPLPDGKSAVLALSLPNGLRLTRTVSLLADGSGLAVDSVLENVSGQAVKDAILRVHPQFVLDQSGGLPEVSVKGAGNALATVQIKKGENFLSGAQMPNGAWALRYPKSGVQVVNEFDRGQVAGCLLYVGPEFVNVELFSPKKTLAPGERLRIQHKYMVTSKP